MKELLDSIQTPSQAAVACCLILSLLVLVAGIAVAAFNTVQTCAIDRNTRRLVNQIRSEVISRINTLQTDLLKSRSDSSDSIIGNVTSNIHAQYAQLRDSLRNLTDIQSRIAQGERSLHTMNNSLVALRQSAQHEFNTLHTDVGTICGRVTNCANGLSSLRTTIESAHSGIKTGNAAFLARLEAIEAIVNRIAPAKPVCSFLPTGKGTSEYVYLAELAALPRELQDDLPTVAPVIGAYGICRSGRLIEEPFEANDASLYPFTDTPNPDDIVGLNTEAGVAELRAKIVQLQSESQPGLPAPATEDAPCQDDEPSPESL